MLKAIYIAALALIAWMLLSKRSSAVIASPLITEADKSLKSAVITPVVNQPVTIPVVNQPVIKPVENQSVTIPVVNQVAVQPSSPVIPTVDPNPGSISQVTNPNPGAPTPTVITTAVVEPLIYTPPAPGELVKVKPYSDGTEVFDTYTDGGTVRPMSEYYQKLLNDKVLYEMYRIFDNHDNPPYKLVDAVSESLATNKPVWLVVLLHVRKTVETGKLEKIGLFVNAANGAFGSISRAFTCNLTEGVLKANANIYLTRETNGLYLKAQYAAGNNSNPMWREVFNMAKAMAN